MTKKSPNWWKINAGDDGSLKDAWLNGPIVSIGWSVGDFRELTSQEIVDKDSSAKSQLSKFVGADTESITETMTQGDHVVAYAPKPVGELIGIGVVGPATYVSNTTLNPPHKNIRSVKWYDSGFPVKLDELPKELRTGRNRVIPGATLERYKGNSSLFEQAPLNVDFDSIRHPPTEKPADGSVPEDNTTDDLVPGPMRELNPDKRDVPEVEETIAYESKKKEQAEANNIHEQTVEVMGKWLREAGWRCRETDETDILATCGDQVLAVEAKSVDGQNDGYQIRRALGQLHENCYRDVIRREWDDQTLLASLVLSQPPADQYLGYLEYLSKQGIETLWVEDDEIGGLKGSISNIIV